LNAQQESERAPANVADSARELRRKFSAMTDNTIDEGLQARDGESSTATATRSFSATQTPMRRFTVKGFERVPHAYVPTLAIGALVVIVATVMFVIKVLWK
jgi:hypothetical protein